MPARQTESYGRELGLVVSLSGHDQVPGVPAEQGQRVHAAGARRPVSVQPDVQVPRQRTRDRTVPNEHRHRLST